MQMLLWQRRMEPQILANNQRSNNGDGQSSHQHLKVNKVIRNSWIRKMSLRKILIYAKDVLLVSEGKEIWARLCLGNPVHVPLNSKVGIFPSEPFSLPLGLLPVSHTGLTQKSLPCLAFCFWKTLTSYWLYVEKIKILQEGPRNLTK